jgi:hypothetical protein
VELALPVRRVDVAVFRRNRLDREEVAEPSRLSRVAERPEEDSVEEWRKGDDDVEEEEAKAEEAKETPTPSPLRRRRLLLLTSFRLHFLRSDVTLEVEEEEEARGAPTPLRPPVRLDDDA